MASIQLLNQRRLFNLTEARLVLPVVRRITRTAHDRVEALIPLLSNARAERTEELDGEIHEVFRIWQEKVERLGGIAKGMWLVDFDNGEGYLCWQYPETELCHFHAYEQGFYGRVKLP